MTSPGAAAFRRTQHLANFLNKTPLAPVWQAWQKFYTGLIRKNLVKFGLRLDDLLHPQRDPDVREALRRLPMNEVLARNARVRRAIDLSAKHEYLDPVLQAKQKPFDFYMRDLLVDVKDENRERRLLGAELTYGLRDPWKKDAFY